MKLDQTTLIKLLAKNYSVVGMDSWENVRANLIATDPPFAIKFSGKKPNYNRKDELVVDGYIEWTVKEYGKKIQELLEVIERNLVENGSALVFSGWNHSHIIHQKILESTLMLRGKLYWSYNFAPHCKKRPATNIYEIYWITKSKEWFYTNLCSTKHCTNGEKNLSTLTFPRDYKVGIPKYPTRLPFNLIQCLLEHFSRKGDLIFDCLAGSGMLGIVSYFLDRKFLLGDLNPNGKVVFKELIKHYFPRLSEKPAIL